MVFVFIKVLSYRKLIVTQRLSYYNHTIKHSCLCECVMLMKTKKEKKTAS